MALSPSKRALGLYDRGDIAFLRVATEAAWRSLAFAVDDSESAYAADLRRRLVAGILRAAAAGETNPARVVDAALADLPPLTARY